MVADISWLMAWYAMQCDADWEHQYGIKIETMDNPGWSLKIDLNATEYESMIIDAFVKIHSEIDWVKYEIKDKVFIGYCGRFNLLQLIRAFRNCVEDWSSAGESIQNHGNVIPDKRLKRDGDEKTDL